MSGWLQRIVNYARQGGHGFAVESPKANVSYGEFLQATIALASRLRVYCAPGDIVAVAGRAGPLHPVSFCACMWSGLVYWPLDVEAPQERLSRLISEAGPTVAVLAEASDEASTLFSSFSIPIVYLNSLLHETQTESDETEDYVNQAPAGAAYRIYT